MKRKLVLPILLAGSLIFSGTVVMAAYIDSQAATTANLIAAIQNMPLPAEVQKELAAQAAALKAAQEASNLQTVQNPAAQNTAVPASVNPAPAQQAPQTTSTQPDQMSQSQPSAGQQASQAAPSVPAAEAAAPGAATATPIAFNPAWKYADKSKINSGTATLYKVREGAPTIAVNAGHGTKGGTSVKTLCHPDGSPKVTGGSTASGATTAIAVSGGTTMLDGTPEPTVTLKLAQKVKDALLQKGYNVLMIRDGADVQLDNVARTLMANNNANAHISLHYDSTTSDKGFFYIGVPNIASYRSMEPVASTHALHTKLGESLLSGAKAAGVKIYGKGTMALDLTQTSYSTIPSVDLEVGDRGSSYSDAALSLIATGIAGGMDIFFRS